MKKRVLSILVALAAALAFSVPAVAGDDDDDVKVTLEQVPEEARATIEREVAGGQILEIEREESKGREIFEVVFKDREGQKFELEVTPDGTLVSKERT